MISRRPVRVISPAPRPSEGQGKPLEGGGLVPSFSGFLTAFCEPEGHRDLRTPCVPGLLSGKGAFFLPPQARFHTHFLFSRPRFFFFVFLAFGARCASATQLQCEERSETGVASRIAGTLERHTPPQHPP